MKVNSHRRRRPGEPARRRGFSLLRVGDWRVPTKLAASLVLPAVAFLVIAGVQINASVDNATKLDQFASGIKVARQLTSLISALQLERDQTAGVLAKSAAGTAGDPNAIAAALGPDWNATNKAVQDFTVATRPLRGIPVFATAGTALTADFLQLNLIRQGVQNRWVRASAAFDQYSLVVQHLFDLVPSGATSGADTESTLNVQSLLALAEVQELTDQLRGLIFADTTAGTFGPDDFETLAAIQARQQSAIQQFRSSASPAHLATYDQTLRSTPVSAVARLQQQVIGQARGTTVSVSPDDWWRASSDQLQLLRNVEQDLLEDSINGAVKRSSQQRQDAFLATSAIVLVMLLALLLSFLIGRSMARSLRQLRAQALDVAQHRLPEAIHRLRNLPRGETVTVDTTTRIKSSDEIGEVADAFTAVHRSAVSLAVEQAVMRRNVNSMFINLARRSQTLVERQLQLLDSLEAAETDPDQLSSLFRLDHLATRMRRNDENLLVLAGSEATRRWAQPVSLAAVTLAAMAEIEQYARIRQDVSNDVFVVGHAVSDIVHLLAELLENATTFSPPDSVVTVSGWPAANGREAMLTIEDHGLGMTESGLVEANERVATPVAIDVAASERMGLVVVGHLADRHNVQVRLDGSDEGVRAYVTLPNRLLAPPPDGGGLYGGATGRLIDNTRAGFEVDAPAADRATGPVDAPVGADAVDTVAVADLGDPNADTAVMPILVRPSSTPGVPGVAAPPLPPEVLADAAGAAPIAAPPGWPPSPLPAVPVADRLIFTHRPANAPVSAMPVSGAPVSGVPAAAGESDTASRTPREASVSGPSVSDLPTSGAPISGAPVSGAPISGAPVSGVPVSAVSAANGAVEAAQASVESGPAAGPSFTSAGLPTRPLAGAAGTPPHPGSGTPTGAPPSAPPAGPGGPTTGPGTRGAAGSSGASGLPRIPVPTSGLPAPTSGIPAAPTSGLPAPTSGIPRPTSGIPRPTSGIPRPTSGIPRPTSGIPRPTSGIPRPTSGLPAPTSGNPPAMSDIPHPTSGVPAAPMSGLPTPGSGIPAQRAGSNGRSTPPPSRRGPTRAEDILDAAARGGAGTPAASNGTRWWSKGGAGSAGRVSPPSVAAPREPVTAGTSEAGLPIRRPMAQLPAEQAAAPPAPMVTVTHGEPDPDQVSSMLARFYSGVHRAGSEDENPTVPINGPRSTA